MVAYGPDDQAWPNPQEWRQHPHSSLARRETFWIAGGAGVTIAREDNQVLIQAQRGPDSVEIFIDPSLFMVLRTVMNAIERPLARPYPPPQTQPAMGPGNSIRGNTGGWLYE